MGMKLRVERKIHFPGRKPQPVAGMKQPPGSVASATLGQIRESVIITKMRTALKNTKGR